MPFPSVFWVFQNKPKTRSPIRIDHSRDVGTCPESFVPSQRATSLRLECRSEGVWLGWSYGLGDGLGFSCFKTYPGFLFVSYRCLFIYFFDERPHVNTAKLFLWGRPYKIHRVPSYTTLSVSHWFQSRYSSEYGKTKKQTKRLVWSWDPPVADTLGITKKKHVCHHLASLLLFHVHDSWCHSI